jgi:hypothetical protein
MLQPSDYQFGGWSGVGAAAGKKAHFNGVGIRTCFLSAPFDVVLASRLLFVLHTV